MTVIPNGIDTQIYHPDKISGKRLRLEWGISDNELVIGHVGRIDPMKDHPNLFNAGAIINQSLHNVRLVCVGDALSLIVRR